VKSVIKVGEKLESRDRGKIPPGTIVTWQSGFGNSERRIAIVREDYTEGEENIFSDKEKNGGVLGYLPAFTVVYLPPDLPKVGEKIKLGQLLNLPPGSLTANNYWRYWSLEDGHCIEQSLANGCTSGSYNRTKWHMSEYPNETLTLIYINN
jgi:hypothetical protein